MLYHVYILRCRKLWMFTPKLNKTMTWRLKEPGHHGIDVDDIHIYTVATFCIIAAHLKVAFLDPSPCKAGTSLFPQVDIMAVYVLVMPRAKATSEMILTCFVGMIRTPHDKDSNNKIIADYFRRLIKKIQLTYINLTTVLLYLNHKQIMLTDNGVHLSTI